MPTTALTTFTASPLEPCFPKPDPIWESFQAGASLTIVKGTVMAIKVADGKVYPYLASTYVTPPATPAFTATSTGGTWPTGVYSVAISYVNPQGETIPSIAAFLSVTNGQQINVPILAVADSTVTAVNVYVNGFKAGSIAVTAGATVATLFPNYLGAGAGNAAPNVNTAQNVTTGLQIARGLSPFDFTTDASGNISYGTSAPNEFGQTYGNTPIYLKGYFNVADLTGLDANAVAQLGRMVTGTYAGGILDII